MTFRRAGAVAVLALLVLIRLALPATAGTPIPGSRTVVVIAVPGLLWSDVESMPSLQDLAARSAVGELTVKTAGSVTRCAAGELAVDAGNRTTSATEPCPIDLGALGTIAASNRSSRYAARIGLLGSALRQHGIRTIAVTPDAQPLIADQRGLVSKVVANVSDGLTGGRPAVVSVLLPQLYDASGAARAAARTTVDSAIDADLRFLPPHADVIVAGISDGATGHANLHPVLISGASWPHVELRSAAGRAPYVQLIDLAPTVLGQFGIPLPSAASGRSIEPTTSAVPPIASYVDDNRHAVGERTLGQRVLLALGLAVILLMLLAAYGTPAARRPAVWLARLLAPAPALVFVGNAFPWWRWGQLAYAGIVVGMCAGVAVVVSLIATRSRAAAVMSVTAVSLLILITDQVTGGHLQLSAPLGDNPLVAGRFRGVGNLDFAVLATSAVVLAAMVGSRLSKVRGAVAAGLILLAVMAVDGLPRLGDDFGGVLTMVPAAIVVVAGVLKVRVSWRRVVLAAAGTAVVAVAVALADYSRSPAKQTHVGRFVGQVLHGGAWTEVHRKADAMFGSFGVTVPTFVAAVAVLLAILRRQLLRAALTGQPGLAPAALGTAVIGVLGTVLNDSGVQVAAVAAIVAVAAVYASGWYSEGA